MNNTQKQDPITLAVKTGYKACQNGENLQKVINRVKNRGEN